MRERLEVVELRCANCGRAPGPGESPGDEWRIESDGTGKLHVFCP